MNEEIKFFPNKRLNTKQAASYLGLSTKTLAMKRCEGTGPKFIKKCGRVFYCLSDLDEWDQSFPKCISTAQARLKNSENP
jgi:hypothetical protein